MVFCAVARQRVCLLSEEVQVFVVAVEVGIAHWLVVQRPVD